jgi:hypothetical protein
MLLGDLAYAHETLDEFPVARLAATRAHELSGIRPVIVRSRHRVPCECTT